MTSRPASRFAALTPSLFFATLLVLAGCATQAPGPVAPISTGDPRVDPVDGTGVHDGTGPVDIGDIGDETDTADALTDGLFTPPHMAGRDLIRAGVMLPFSDRRANVREQAQGMLAGIELALFDYAGDNFVILPKDTRGSKTTAKAMAEELAEQGVDLVLGPIFGANVIAAQAGLVGSDVPVVAFSNDSTVAGDGTWLASLAPEAEIAEIIRYASLRGYDQFAFFGAQSALGQKIERTMQFEVARNGGRMIASGFYPPTSTNPDTEAKYFADLVAQAASLGGQVAVLVPERGNRLRRIAPLLAYHGIDTRQVKMLGISSWNDPAIWREPSLKGAWFPAPPKVEVDDFALRYQRQYGRAPSSLAAVAYDAASLAIALSVDGDLTTEELLNRDGFSGVNGLFRFRSDGLAQRSLAIMEIDPAAEDGAKEIRPVAQSFDPTTG